MRKQGYIGILTAAAIAVAILPAAAGAAQQVWAVGEATATLSLDPDHLANLGLEVVDARTTSSRFEPRELMLEGPTYAFEAVTGFEADFRAVDGSFQSFVDGRIEIPVDGGLAFRTRHPASGAALTPAFLYDFVVEVDLSRHDAIRLRSADSAVPVPLEVVSVGAHLHADRGQLALPMGDLVISRAWAQQLGQPELAGQWVGVFDLRLEAELVRGEAVVPSEPDFERGSVLDVLLGELYGITSAGHIGTYPNGIAGLSAATTSCNNGNTNVPWNAPMAETHPTIGLALFRIKDGVVECLGQNWMKHGWFALSNDQCDLGCVGGGGSYLAVGCSDTYSAGNNASRFYLGPRREVNPYLGEWEACGSYFDGSPVDCQRDEDGNGLDDVAHRLTVHDEDLGDGAWTYYYEGCYFVADDDSTHNNIGWRECDMTWSGSNWSFSTVGAGLDPGLGPVIRLAGGTQTTQSVASDDGEVILALTTTDLGGGQWHYEYALYNRDSDRGINSFAVPIDGVTVSNVGFRDIDKNGANDWTVTNDGSTLSWATDDYATDPDSNWLHFQLLFNFSFDADAPPTATAAAGGIHKPGVGSVVYIQTQGPFAGATSALANGSVPELALSLTGANPFSQRARLEFTVPREEHATLSVLDVTGRTVQVLVDGDAPAGRNVAAWNGRDATGSRVASGVYFFRLETAEGTKTVKGTFVR
jgi:hypothetical protein